MNHHRAAYQNVLPGLSVEDGTVDVPVDTETLQTAQLMVGQLAHSMLACYHL